MLQDPRARIDVKSKTFGSEVQLFNCYDNPDQKWDVTIGKMNLQDAEIEVM